MTTHVVTNHAICIGELAELRLPHFQIGSETIAQEQSRRRGRALNHTSHQNAVGAHTFRLHVVSYLSTSSPVAGWCKATTKLSIGLLVFILMIRVLICAKSENSVNLAK